MLSKKEIQKWILITLEHYSECFISDQKRKELEEIIDRFNKKEIDLTIKETNTIQKTQGRKNVYKITDIEDYLNKITPEQGKLLIRHCNKYNIHPKICAWYNNWEDFCIDWCDYVGLTKTEAREKLQNSNGEFKIFPNGEIIRISM